jgi:hypothetical protein
MGKMLGDSDKARQGWRKLMTPELLRANLIRCSIYLTAFELLQQALIEQPLAFFAYDFTAEGEPVMSTAYREHVLSLSKYSYEASARWFQKMGALTAGDVDRLTEIREHRNRVAHDVPKIIMTVGADVNPFLLKSIAELTAKIDRWWIREIEVPLNSNFDHVELDEQAFREAVSGRMVVMDLLISVAFNDEERLAELEAAYRRALEFLRST